MSSSNDSDRPDNSMTNSDFKVEQEPLDYDLAMRTVMYFGLEIPREEAFNRVGVLLSQEDSWDRLWDELDREKMWKVLEGVQVLEQDLFFVRRSLYRLRPPREPQAWSSDGWKTSRFLIDALQNRRPSISSIRLKYAFESFPEAFPTGEPGPHAHSSPSEDVVLSHPKLSDGSGMPIDEFIELARQQTRNETERILDIVTGRSDQDVDEFFEGLTLLRLTPSLETQVWSNGAWENEPSLIHELREGRLPEAIHKEEVSKMFPEVF